MCASGGANCGAPATSAAAGKGGGLCTCVATQTSNTASFSALGVWCWLAAPATPSPPSPPPSCPRIKSPAAWRRSTGPPLGPSLAAPLTRRSAAARRRATPWSSASCSSRCVLLNLQQQDVSTSKLTFLFLAAGIAQSLTARRRHLLFGRRASAWRWPTPARRRSTSRCRCGTTGTSRATSG